MIYLGMNKGFSSFKNIGCNLYLLAY